METFSAAKVKEIISGFEGNQGDILPILQEVEETFGYIPRETVPIIGEALKVSPSKLYGVTTFYTQFHLTPRGKNVINVCCGTACHVKDGDRVLDKVKATLGIEADETTEDGEYTLREVACLGCCGLAPVITINGKAHGKITEDAVEEILKGE